MKMIFEQAIYSLYNNQEQIDMLEKIPQNSIEILQSVLDNEYLPCSSLSKRISLYSLSNSSLMIKTNFIEEQTNSIHYDNTYFSSEDLSKFDDCSSLTSITSNFTNDYSDIEEIHHELFTSSNSNFIGLIHSKNSQNTEQIFSDQNNTIRSSIDNISLNSSMTSSIHILDQQLNKHKEKRTNQDDDDDDDEEYYIIVDQQKTTDQLTIMNNQNDVNDDDEVTKLYDKGQHDGIQSDESQNSDDLRCSSYTMPNNDISNNTNSILRQQAMSLNKVRCKQRKTWINSSKKSLKPFIANNQVDETNDISSCLNANMNAITTPSKFLHKNSFDCKMNVETPSYDFIQLNSDHRSMKTDESIVSPLLKTNNTHDKDASSTSKKTNNFYLIHHQSSLIPIKDFLNKKNLQTNIEYLQMDEQECILEIVDGVVTIVRKDQSLSSSINTDEDKSVEDEQEQERKSSIEYQTSENYDSPKREKRSSSIASSISTPSISEHEHEQEHEEISSSSRSTSNKEQIQEPFILLHDNSSKSPPLPSQTDQSVDLLDLFSTPPVPLSNSNTNNNNNDDIKNSKNLLDDSLSSVSSYEQNNSHSESLEKEKIRSSSPIPTQSKLSSPSTSIKDDVVPNTKTLLINEPEVDYPIPKSEPPPVAKPINKARINEFASLLSSAVHLTQPPIVNKKTEIPKTNPSLNHPAPSPSRSEDQSYSSILSTHSDRDERESYHTVKTNPNSEFEQTKKHIDARYNEKIDDRKSIQINTSNIKALFEQKISDTNEQLTEIRQHRKIPNSYTNSKHHLSINSPQTNRRQSFQDSSTMNKYTDHISGTKEVVIEDKQPEHGHQTQLYGQNNRRNNTEQIIRPEVDSLTIPNGYYSETLIAREIRETKEKEEELRQQRKKCGLPQDVSSLITISNNDLNKSEQTTKQPIKNSSFLSNLDFFTTKANQPNTPRRSTISIQNLVYDSHGNDERKSIVSQELNRFNNNNNNNNNIPIVRASSTNNTIHRSASNQNLGTNTNNIIQREIEAIRAKEVELRQLGRIQHTSDEHSDPRKYQELVSPIPKSHSVNILSTGKSRKETERINGPMTATSNGILKPKQITTTTTTNNNNNNSSVSSIRGKFPSPNPTAPIISSSNKSIDYSKLSSTDRLELEKRECQEREQELRKQRHSVSSTTLSANSTVNGDSGNVSQDEHEEDQERYFDKIQRLKRTENEKAQAPLIRPTKKLDLSQKWEQMMANKNNATGDDDDDDDKY